MRQNQEHYENKDFYESAYLIHSGIELESHRKEGTYTIFCFNDTPKLRKLLDTYYSLKATVEPMKFCQVIRTLKSIIHNTGSDRKIAI